MRNGTNARSLLIAIALLSLGPSLALGQDAPAAAGSLQALDDKNGFRDAAFGAGLSAFQGMALAQERPDGWKMYTRADDSMAFGAANLSRLTYGFYADQLGRVLLEAVGSDCERLLGELKIQYGIGYRQNETLEDTWWVGQNVNLQYEKSGEGCLATFESKAVLEASTDTTSGGAGDASSGGAGEAPAPDSSGLGASAPAPSDPANPPPADPA